jgi:ribosomal protein L40E
MPEALTESFCERCGTRYEFAAPTELNTIRKTRGLISGLKNYIMSQDALSDAVGDAMRSEQEALASQQLDAFHEQFNFCINCRQYTCTNCWNDDAGRCRTCAPIAGTDDLLERFEATFQAQHPELAAGVADAELEQAELNRRLGLEAWPTEDLVADATNGNGAPPITEWPSEESLPAVAEETEPPALEPEPEQEPLVAEVAPEPEPEPMVAEVAPEPEPEPEPIVPPAPVEPQPIRPISETILHVPPPVIEPPAVDEELVAAQADDPLLAARRAQLDLLGLGDPGEGPVTSDRKVLPYRSGGASVHPLELAQRAAAGLPEPGAFWEASAREVAGVMSHVGVQSCGECGLSLSASARFCRRCGTRQAKSA